MSDLELISALLLGDFEVPQELAAQGCDAILGNQGNQGNQLQGAEMLHHPKVSISTAGGISIRSHGRFRV